MKRYTYILLTTLTVILTQTACSNEQVETVKAVKPILFSATMQQPVTRAGVYVGDVQNTAFVENEVVDVFIKEHGGTSMTYAQPIYYKGTTARDDEVDGKVYYALGDPRNSSNVQLTAADVAWPNDNNGIDIWAFHPTGAVTNLSAANTFSVKSDQSTNANYRLSDLMAAERTNVARQDERVQLTFTHLLSKVIVTLKGDRSLNINHEGWRDGATEGQQRAAQIEANSCLVGARVDLMSIKPTTTITSPNTIATASGSANIYVGTIVTTTELVDADDAASAWQIACIIPPQTIAAGASMLKITMADGGVLYYKPAVLCTFTLGHVNTYNITVHAKELTLTGSTVDPWTVGDTDQGHEAQPVITL